MEADSGLGGTAADSSVSFAEWQQGEQVVPPVEVEVPLNVLRALA